MDAVKPIIKDLGWCIARGRATRMLLTICSPSDDSNGDGHCPAASVEICCRENIEALRDICIELLASENKQKEGNK